MKMHYAGAVRYTTASGWHHEKLAGWAACCSGDRAIHIRTTGNHTYDRDKVDCLVCLRVLKEHDHCNAAKLVR